jgi:hypothetical protein
MYMDVYLKDITKKDKNIILYYMASEEKGPGRLIRANTPDIDDDFFDSIEQEIMGANIAHMQRKAGNDPVQQQINKNIAQFKPETDRLQKEKVRLQKELSKKRGAFGRAPSCYELQQQLISIEEDIEKLNKKILKAANLSEAEKSHISYFGGKKTRRRRKRRRKKKTKNYRGGMLKRMFGKLTGKSSNPKPRSNSKPKPPRDPNPSGISNAKRRHAKMRHLRKIRKGLKKGTFKASTASASSSVGGLALLSDKDVFGSAELKGYKNRHARRWKTSLKRHDEKAKKLAIKLLYLSEDDREKKLKDMKIVKYFLKGEYGKVPEDHDLGKLAKMGSKLQWLKKLLLAGDITGVNQAIERMEGKETLNPRMTLLIAQVAVEVEKVVNTLRKLWLFTGLESDRDFVEWYRGDETEELIRWYMRNPSNQVLLQSQRARRDREAGERAASTMSHDEDWEMVEHSGQEGIGESKGVVTGGRRKKRRKTRHKKRTKRKRTRRKRR